MNTEKKQTTDALTCFSNCQSYSRIEIDSSKHSCECMCLYCQKNQTGYFIKGDVYDGNDTNERKRD